MDMHIVARRLAEGIPWETVAKHFCRVETDLQADNPVVDGDEDLLESVMQNPKGIGAVMFSGVRMDSVMSGRRATTEDGKAVVTGRRKRR